eukprot:jgi/Botrbrau1/17284/Bobra.0015s0041.1
MLNMNSFSSLRSISRLLHSMLSACRSSGLHWYFENLERHFRCGQYRARPTVVERDTGAGIHRCNPVPWVPLARGYFYTAGTPMSRVPLRPMHTSMHCVGRTSMPPEEF